MRADSLLLSAYHISFMGIQEGSGLKMVASHGNTLLKEGDYEKSCAAILPNRRCGLPEQRAYPTDGILTPYRVGVFVQLDGVFACGISYCGSSGVNRNVCLPITGIVTLSQAPVTSIVPLTGLRAFRRIWEGCTVNLWDRQAVMTCSDLVSQAVQRVPVFHLACTPDRSAVVALEQAIGNLG
jgi:hypothetical protein